MYRIIAQTVSLLSIKKKTKSMVGDLIPLTVFFLLIIISYLYAFFFYPFFFHLNLRDVKILMLF